jgi:siderophore synthetase component
MINEARRKIMTIHTIKWLELTAEERDVYTYLQQAHPDLANLFMEKLPVSRHSIMNRLLRSIVREGFLPKEAVSYGRRGEKDMLEVLLNQAEKLTVPVLRMSGDRFDIQEDVMLWKNGEASFIRSASELLHHLIRTKTIAVSEDRLDRFREEIRNSTANYALALTGAEVRRKELKAEADKQSLRHSLEWVEQQAEQDPSFSPLSFYEQWVIDGHTLHPCSKTKFGLDPADVIAYSPEWGAQPGLKLAAVRKSCCYVTALDDQVPSQWLAEEYPDELKLAQRQLREKLLRPEEYEWVIVHPWQFEHTIPALFSDEMNRQDIVLIEEGDIPASALVSFRTFAPPASAEKKRHHIKTAVNIQMTSAVRTVSPQSTINGPALSRVLARVQKREPALASYFAMIEDRMGAYFQLANAKDDRSRQLAFILRENPESRTEKGEISLPGAALLAQSPLSEKPIMLELIERFMKASAVTCLSEGAEKFMAEYVRICAGGFLTLLCRYGISLEGHLQNSVAVFRDGMPVKLVVRDYGGVRIFKERLLARQFEREETSFEPPLETEDVEEARRVLSHAVFQNHIGELISCLVREWAVEEKRLWNAVGSSFQEIFEQLKEDDSIKEAVMEDEAYFFGESMDLKALMSMRLYDEAASYEFVKIANPLYSWRKEESEL